MADFNRWREIKKLSGSTLFSFTWFLMATPEFRNIVLYRFMSQKKYGSYIIARILFKPVDTLFIKCPDIEGGLFIEHGFATVISAKHIGKNFWVNQQVTIGYNGKTDCPYIEDNVHVSAGAIIVGNIHLGNNSRVGAGAVVVRDVAESTTVVGVPAKAIEY